MNTPIVSKSTKVKKDPKKITQNFIKEIRRIRREKEISQEFLANAAGVHRNYIGMIERGENSPSLEIAISIAVALGVKLEKLFKGL
jgi:DNA-binding XRE family transcriptional regulator